MRWGCYKSHLSGESVDGERIRYIWIEVPICDEAPVISYKAQQVWRFCYLHLCTLILLHAQFQEDREDRTLTSNTYERTHIVSFTNSLGKCAIGLYCTTSYGYWIPNGYKPGFYSWWCYYSQRMFSSREISRIYVYQASFTPLIFTPFLCVHTSDCFSVVSTIRVKLVRSLLCYILILTARRNMPADIVHFACITPKHLFSCIYILWLCVCSWYNPYKFTL